MIQSLNPANGKLLRSFDPLTPEALNAKLAIAASAAKTYPKETLDQRIFWMRRLAALLEADIEELAITMTSEMGKTLVSARDEVSKCAAGCRYYADNAARILAPERIATEHSDSYVRYDPLGVILAVMPWNFPLWQVFRFLAPALMAGNIGLLKHASNVPQCALAIEALVRRAGFPRGVFQTLLIEARQVEHLLNDPRVAAVTLTGSEAAGRAVAAQAGWLVKKSVLELGGSDPFIVLPSANLAAAVENAIKARCINNGQSCIAAKRIIVHESIYTEFEKRFVAGMADLRIGDPMLETTDIGPLATPEILEELLQQVTMARESGGRVLTGGARAFVEDGDMGNYFKPTVIAGLMRNAPICQEEIFGPVALLFRVASLDDAIALANDTPFGLAASAWTTDDAERQRLAIELQCGAVFFNTPVASDPRLPFGGIKRSGYGRELGAAGMREFLNAKTIVVAELPAETHPTPLDKSTDKSSDNVKPKPTSEPPADPRSDKPNEFQHIADQIRKFEPNKPSSPTTEPNSPNPLQPEPTSAEPIPAEPPPPEPAPSQLNPQEPNKDDDTPPPPDGSMLHLR
ncbi:NAD-dependent succinate-semialdehyde dehydrogenase [Granulicella sp. L46]|uniref:NAD-dependent succinate-semialdehyde dehydrogenase n=1 Tax=Granulicella sp. L46 TaxID=1641865 RepID=UPI00131B626B|nr:NAD-dependent succinate-semialdehyde dehydrogenase [Granulicella sp. L46]